MNADINEIYSSCHVLLFCTMSHFEKKEKKSVVQFNSPVKQVLYKTENKNEYAW